VCGEQDDGASVCCCGRGEFGESIAGCVEVRVVEAEVAEALQEPAGASGFGEGRGGYAEELDVPAAELLLVQMEPTKGPVHAGVRAELGDASVSFGGHD